MDTHTKNQMLKTLGWITVAVGLYMVHEGSKDDVVVKDGVIDAVFEVIED